MAPARRRFGQHFLHDRHYIERIVAAVSPQAGERIVEIGPGRGALTLALLDIVGELDVIEIDRDLAAYLDERCRTLGDLRVHTGDVLETDLRNLCPDAETKLRVIGNLPYNISTPLLFHLMGQIGCIRDMIFMLQREVAERIAASPGGADYGRLSVMIQYHCDANILFAVPPGAFSPPPRVDSAVVSLQPRRSTETAHSLPQK